MTRKNPFGTKGLYRLLFIHILHYSAIFCLFKVTFLLTVYEAYKQQNYSKALFGAL